MRNYDHLNETKTTDGGYLVAQRRASYQVIAEFPSYVESRYANAYVDLYLQDIIRAGDISERPRIVKGLCKGLALISGKRRFAVGSIAAMPWGGFLFPIKGFMQRWFIALLPYKEWVLQRALMRKIAHGLMLLLLLTALLLLLRSLL